MGRKNGVQLPVAVRSKDMILRSIALAFLAAMVGCAAPRSDAPVSDAQSAAMYRPKIDVREVRQSLKGRSMRDVVRKLGQPTSAYTVDQREVWSYEDRARDSITGKPVHLLEVIFRDRKVQDVNFSM